MKIGLLTYHNSTSYGATLQTYATCRQLENMGHEVTLIDLPLNHESASLLKSFAFSLKNYKTKRLWNSFYPAKTERFNSYEDLRKARIDFDCLLVGSDQTWNPDINKELYRAFFLDFGGEDVRRVSYASSFGISKWPEKYNKQLPVIKDALSKFYAISTRELEGQQLLCDLFGLNSTIVLDPTLLNTDYSELTGEIKPNGKFICFTMRHTLKQLEVTKQISFFFGYTPYQIATIYPCKGFKYVYPPTIPQWLRYIAGADYVITDSFHGLVFCLIYHKQFLVITPKNNRLSRLKNLLKLVGLNDRFFYEDDEINMNLLSTPIDYLKVDKILNVERHKSIEFLKSALRR